MLNSLEVYHELFLSFSMFMPLKSIIISLLCNCVLLGMVSKSESQVSQTGAYW